MAEGDPTGLKGAADRIRETAKWLTVSLAAIGGVLVAGTQLSDIGSLEPGSDRFRVAIVAAVVAATGSALVLWATTSTATVSAVSLTDLASDDPPPGTSQARADKHLLRGYESVNELKTDYESSLNSRRQTYTEWVANPGDPQKEAAARQADAYAVSMSSDVRGLLEVAAYQALFYKWRRWRWLMLVGGVLAATGIGMFAWAANPPAPVGASVVTPGLLKTPINGRLQLSNLGREVVRGQLGDSCRIDRPMNVLLLGTADVGSDVLVEQAGCRLARFVLVPAWGSVVVVTK